MTSFEIYVFILCLIVFILLTTLFTYMIALITSMQLKLIRNGHEDEAIKKEYLRNQRISRALNWLNRIFSAVLCLVFSAAFLFAMYMNIMQDRPANGIPSIKVVKSESMASKNEKNTYLITNDLNDQFQMFDVVFCRHLPAEEELELYDVVVYKQDDIYVIHRIVGIEEPNENHPNERHFLLQGDAVERPDKFPVLYSQMQGIYEGERIPYVGSFVLFMQSPAGWLCILLVLFAMIATPIVEKKLKQETDARFRLIESDEFEHTFS